MKGYRVIFENNIPAFARQVEALDKNDFIKLSMKGDKRMLNWLLVYGDSEADALEIASKVLKTIWAEYLAWF